MSIYTLKTPHNGVYSMRFEDYEIDLLIETIDFRLENDSSIHYQNSLKKDLKDLLGKIEENEED